MSGRFKWTTVGVIGALAASVLSLGLVTETLLRLALLGIPFAMLLAAALVVSFLVKPPAVPIKQRTKKHNGYSLELRMFGKKLASGSKEDEVWDKHLNDVEDYMSQVLICGAAMPMVRIRDLKDKIEEKNQEIKLLKEERDAATEALNKERTDVDDRISTAYEQQAAQVQTALEQFTTAAEALTEQIQKRSKPQKPKPQQQPAAQRRECDHCHATKDAHAPYQEDQYHLASGEPKTLYLCKRCRPGYDAFRVSKPAASKDAKEGKKQETTATT